MPINRTPISNIKIRKSKRNKENVVIKENSSDANKKKEMRNVQNK